MTLLTVGPLAGQKPARKPRLSARRLFAAACALTLGGGLSLVVRAGCWIVETDKDGERVAQRRDDRARLWLTVGDRLIVSDWNPADPGVAAVAIDHVAQDGASLAVHVLAGQAPTSAVVHVQPMRRRHA